MGFRKRKKKLNGKIIDILQELGMQSFDIMLQKEILKYQESALNEMTIQLNFVTEKLQSTLLKLSDIQKINKEIMIELKQYKKNDRWI